MLEIILDYEDFIVVKNGSHYYAIYSEDGYHTIEKLQLIKSVGEDVENVFDVDFDYDYSGEELDGTNYLYFKKYEEDS